MSAVKVRRTGTKRRVEEEETTWSSVDTNEDYPADLSIAHDKRRSKVCSVCKGESETYHLNYGASSCFSCRAFFRRAIQKDRDPKFICKRGGTCEITLKTRKQCRKCRYDLCIQNGMTPDSVLNEIQKKERFRKMIHKRFGGPAGDHLLLADIPLSYNLNYSAIKEMVKESQATAGGSEVDEQEVGEFMEQLRAKRKAEKADASQPMDLSEGNLHFKRKFLQMYQDEEEHQRSSSSCHSSESGYSGEVSQPAPSRSSLSKHKMLSLNFCWMSARLSYPVAPDLIGAFVDYHQTGQGLSKAHFVDLLRHLTGLFHTFARQFPDFGVLSQRTQEYILRENTPLFLAFFLGKYFGSSNGNDQISWLFPSHKVEHPIQHVPFQVFQQTLGLFQDAREALAFENIISAVDSFHLEQRNTHLITHACLFHMRHHTEILDDSVLLAQFSAETTEFLVEEAFNPTEVPFLLRNLQELAKIFSYL